MNVVGGGSRWQEEELSDALDKNREGILLPDGPYFFPPRDASAIAAISDARVVGPFPGHLVTWHGSRTIEGLRFLANV